MPDARNQLMQQGTSRIYKASCSTCLENVLQITAADSQGTTVGRPLNSFTKVLCTKVPTRCTPDVLSEHT